MTDITLHVAKESHTTSVANVFIDYYMKDANGEYVKIYLYLLRCLGDVTKDFSISQVADALDHTQRDISRALLYWQEQGLLELEYTIDGELSGICLREPAAEHSLAVRQKPSAAKPEDFATAAEHEPAKTIKPDTIAPDEKHMYSLDEIQLLSRNTDVQEILFITERYMGHPLSVNDVNTVLYWYDGMHFSADLIEYLVEYCIELSHKSIHYMNKVAISWAENGINTVDDAKEVSVSYNKLYSVVMKAFGITGRTLTGAEREFLSRWSNLWSMPNDLIEEACKRTILKTGKPSFQYADSILDNWHKAKAYSLESVETLDAVHARTSKLLSQKEEKRTPAKTHGDRFHNFSSRSYDFGSLESRLLSQQ